VLEAGEVVELLEAGQCEGHKIKKKTQFKRGREKLVVFEACTSNLVKA
jgi:hypothetical protein